MSTSFVVCLGNKQKRYALFSAGVCVLEITYQRQQESCVKTLRADHGSQTNEKLNAPDFEQAFLSAAKEVDLYIKQNRLPAISQVVLKVAVPGTYFQEHRQISADFFAELQKKEKTSPLQVVPLLRELKLCQSIFSEVEIYAASDTAFHATLPTHARQYSLSPELTKTLDLYKFGANGLQLESVVRRAHAVLGIDPERLVICHIDDSVSVTAVYQGKSIETSGGLGLGSGFPLATQAGELDIAAIFHIMKTRNLKATEGELFLSTQGGWLATAGTTDMQTLLQRVGQGDEPALQALKLFTYKVQQAIATATVALQGVDAVVFTGAMGVQSPELRSAILQELVYAKMQINEERNNAMCGKDGVISERNSGVKLVVLKGDELSEINSAVKKVQLTKNAKINTL